MRGLQPVVGIARTELAGLHQKRRQKRRQADQKNWVAKRSAKKTAKARDHRGWRILVHARAGFKRPPATKQPSCTPSQKWFSYGHDISYPAATRGTVPLSNRASQGLQFP